MALYEEDAGPEVLRGQERGADVASELGQRSCSNCL
jgi:hypothetical protein